MNDGSGRREGLRGVLGRSLDARGATAVHASAGNGGAHRARWRVLGLAMAFMAVLMGLALLSLAPHGAERDPATSAPLKPVKPAARLVRRAQRRKPPKAAWRWTLS